MELGNFRGARVGGKLFGYSRAGAKLFTYSGTGAKLFTFSLTRAEPELLKFLLVPAPNINYFFIFRNLY